MDLDILYEDNHLLVLNKPPGLLTQPSGTDRDSLEERAKAWIKETCAKPGAVFLEAVHRIDAPASGIVVFGRTSKALTRLNAAIRERRAAKGYLAVVQGRPPRDTEDLRHFLRHDEHRAKVVAAGTKGAAEARLRYRMIGFHRDRALLQIDLETGRYHQIRAQLAAIGCPIVGDTRYGGPGMTGPGIALHHARLELAHPVQGHADLIVEAPLPATWPWAV